MGSRRGWVFLDLSHSLKFLNSTFFRIFLRIPANWRWGRCFKSNKCPQSSLGQTFEPRALCSLLKRGLLLKGCGCIASRGAGASGEASRAGLVIQVDQGKNPGGGVNVLPACGDASPSAGRCRYDRVSHSEMVNQELIAR